MTAETADEALAGAHRALFGRLVGWLFRMTGDVELAEDAVSAAFASAVPAWRAGGIPRSPEAWLRVAARNNARSAMVRRARSVPVDPVEFADLEAAPDAAGEDLDDRLALLLVCAHPAIDPRLHAPLMLQLVLGVDAARIAGVYLVPPATMGQRLSRAKRKIKDAGIRYRRPEPEDVRPRMGPLLQAVYGAYGSGDLAGGARDSALRAEALRLAEVLTEVVPDEPETWGLLSLLLHTESRRPARVVDGEFVPLGEQDTALWSSEQRRRADACLRRAATAGAPGRFQLEAAISAVHSGRGDGIPVYPDALVTLYRGLLQVAPSVGAAVGAAGALIQAGDAAAAASLLHAVPEASVRSYQPYWVCRAELHTARAETESALAAFDVAIGLTDDPAVRAYLVRTRLRRSAEGQDPPRDGGHGPRPGA
ncbi:RNA polymerase sigma factor [Microbacterium insulae]|uniref:RNA polymerase sigma factor n=1 Tax=Microbacterium insulae TaxID=483014 RepID=A0ABW3AHP3_9MICO